MTHGNDQIENVLRHPISTVIGGITSMAGVALAAGLDPVSFAAAVAQVAGMQAMNLFTAFSILGFTIGGELSFVPSGTFKALALVFGAIVVWKLLNGVYDSIKERMDK